jgi:DNA-3-methyladenine glycosylase I
MQEEMDMDKKRCAWVSDDPLYIAYHDKEWGVPIYNDRLLFEFLNLEGMQAGLSWITILKKRENYRKAFHHFNPEKILAMKKAEVNKLMTNEGIIRSELKINAIINNAKCYLEMKEKYGKFSSYIWQFVDGSPIKNAWKSKGQVPATSDISDKLAKDLKKHGFKFVGSTICYAYMQAVGMVNDHVVDCFRYHECDS